MARQLSRVGKRETTEREGEWHGQEGEGLPKAEEPQGRSEGMHAPAGQEMPRQRQGASLRQAEKGQVSWHEDASVNR